MTTNATVNETVTSSRTFYHHASCLSRSNLRKGGKYDATVDSHAAIATLVHRSLKGRVERWIGCLPYGSFVGPFESSAEAIDAVESRLFARGWTLDRDQAMRRATREAELRTSGELRFSGPRATRRADLDRIRSEIAAIM